MTRTTRRLLRPALAVVLLLAVAPAAHATLLVRSDGNGLLISDKNGFADETFVRAGAAGEDADYVIEHRNIEAFAFDRQAGCRDGGISGLTVRAFCDRNGSKINVQLAGGSDEFGFVNLGSLPTIDMSLAGSSGNDTVTGQPGRDSLDGGTGNDKLVGLTGNDPLSGDTGADRLEGGPGNDTLKGESGSDALFGGTGVDVLEGSTENDFIEAKEPSGFTSEKDTISCGSGFDTVVGDLKDGEQSLTGCEERDISPVGETPHVAMAARSVNVNRAGAARVRLSCPRRTTIGCRGTLSLKLARRGARRPARTRYSIRAGRSARVRVRLSRAEARRARGVAILASVERGKLGRKTTLRSPRLR